MNINIDDYLRINLTDMVLVIISTLLICFLAKKYFWKSALGYLDRRKQIIDDQLTNASKALADGDAYKDQYAQQLKGAHSEAVELIADARETAKQQGQSIVKKAQVDAKNTLEKAQRDIQQEKLNAQKEIKKEITQVAFLAAEKILQEEIDSKKQDQYVSQFIEEKGE